MSLPVQNRATQGKSGFFYSDLLLNEFCLGLSQSGHSESVLIALCKHAESRTWKDTSASLLLPLLLQTHEALCPLGFFLKLHVSMNTSYNMHRLCLFISYKSQSGYWKVLGRRCVLYLPQINQLPYLLLVLTSEELRVLPSWELYETHLL